MKNRIILEDDENSRKHDNYIAKLENKLNQDIEELST